MIEGLILYSIGRLQGDCQLRRLTTWVGVVWMTYSFALLMFRSGGYVTRLLDVM